MTTTELTAAQREDLEIARGLAAAGIPLYIAPPANNKIGFQLPDAWQQTEADPSVVDQWQPGMALCAVMGHDLDLADFDPRNGGDPNALNGATPRTYAVASTPSGGLHWFIASLGVGSRDNFMPGIDLKGGMADGTGRGFAFIAPTERVSKVTGELAGYRWVELPDLSQLGAEDTSGAVLAAQIRELKGNSSVRSASGPEWYQRFLEAREPQSEPAAQRAIADKLAEVRDWTATSGAGFRQTLMRAAMTLGGYVGGGYLDEADAVTQLEQAAGEVWNGADEDDRLWIAQGLADGATKPFHVYVNEELLTHPVPPVALDADESPVGPLVHQVSNEPDSFLWLLSELGVRGLAGMFRRGRSLVYCSRVDEEDYQQAPNIADDNGPATVSPANHQALQARVALGYLVWRWAGGQRNPYRIKMLLPPAVCKNTLEVLESAPNLRTLRGVTHTPMVRRDGSILNTPGYDSSTGYLYLPDVLVPSVPEQPTHEQVVAATALLRGLFADFIWAGEHDEANFLGLLLTPLLRELCPPPYKLAAIMARQPGSGKSLLAKVLRLIHGAVFRTEMPADDAELAKSITAILTQTTAPIVQFDNVTGVLKSSRLAGLLTSGVYSDRVLGSTNNTEIPNDRLWAITGNNLGLGGDLIRRTLWVTIDPQVPNPERRTNFRITDLPGHVAEHRGEILHALLVLVRAWIVAGRPAQLKSSDDYARWAATVRGILQVAGVPGEFDHLDSRQQTEAVDDSDWLTFLEAIAATFGEQPWPVKALLAKVQDGREAPTMLMADTYTAEHPIPYDALPAELTRSPRSTGGVSSLGKSLGMWLRNREGRWAGNLTVRKAGNDSHTKAQLWRVEVYRGRNPDGADPQTPEFAVSAVPAEDVAYPKYEKNQKNIKIESREPTPQTLQTPQTFDLAESPPTGKPDTDRSLSSSKVEARAARARLNEEKRQAAIAEVGGEVLALPVVVDREGPIIPVNLEQARAIVVRCLARSGALTVDVETSGYPIGHPLYALRSVQLGDSTAAVVFDPDAHAALIRELLDGPKLHAHSATADLPQLEHAGLIDETGWERMHDTVIPAKLADPSSTGAAADGLKQLAPGVLGPAAVLPAANEARAALFKAGKWLKSTEVTTPLEKSGWANVETGCVTMLRYAASDVLDTAALAQVLPLPAPEVYERERLAQRMTARVAHRGVRIDGAYVAELLPEHTRARDEAAQRVMAFGVEKPGSDQQVAAALAQRGASLPKTPGGQPSVAKDALEPYKGAEGEIGELVRAVLDYKHHAKVLTGFLEPYRVLCESGDGRARPTVYTLGTDTGRMSCVRPNLQQLPRQGGVRACITADPGQLMIGADFSGVELRVAAALSGDSSLAGIIEEEDAFNRDIAARAQAEGIAEKAARALILAERGQPNGGLADGLHWEIARMVFGPEATKEHRYKAKPMVFQRLYGGGVAGLARKAGVPQEVAQAIVDALDELTPTLSAWSASVRDAVKAGHTQFRTYAGRTIHLPREYPHKGPNYCIQGTARELLVDALVKWRDTKWGNAVLLPVHDELDVFVPEQDAVEATAALVACMETELFGIKIVADPSAPAFAWADSS